MKGSYWLLLVFVTVLFAQPGQGKRLARSTLNERVDTLTVMTRRHSVIRINTQQYRELVTVSPRNYTVVIMFTATALNDGCPFCVTVRDQFQIVADSHHRVAHNRPDKLLFFAMLDMADGQDVFNLKKITMVPKIINYPAKGRPGPKDTIEIELYGSSAEQIAKWITARTDIRIRVVQPRNYTAYLIYIMMAIIISVICIYKDRNNMKIFCNTTCWAFSVIGFCCLMASGHMWNMIDGSRYYLQSWHDLVLVARSQYLQSTVETFIVMAMYGLVSLGMIVITEAGVRKGDLNRRKKMAVVGMVLLMGFFSVLLFIVRMKMPSYMADLFAISDDV